MRRSALTVPSTAGNEPYLRHPRIIRGPELELLDYENLCVHARFCMRAGGIWNLTEQSGNPEARKIAIEEACNCPSGRLVIKDQETGKVIEPELEKSIVIIEYPPRGEHGPLWVRGGIPVVSADGKPYHHPEPAHALPVREIGEQTVLRREPRTALTTEDGFTKNS